MMSVYVKMRVEEQGLPSLANGAGLKIQSHRGSGVQIPSPAYFQNLDIEPIIKVIE